MIEITMETNCFNADMMAQGVKNSKKQEAQTAVRGQSSSLDPLKDDGIRKELYRIERKAQECWNEKWGFLKNSRKLEEEIAKQHLQHQIFDLKRKEHKTSSGLKGQRPAFALLPSGKIHLKTSEMIGWRLFSQKNELNRLVGPMYVSPKLTMKPPLAPDEPDLTQQKILFLG